MNEQHELISRAEYKTNDLIIPFQYKKVNTAGLVYQINWTEVLQVITSH